MALNDLPDFTLLKECRKGNDKAFNVLFRRYFNKLFRYTLNYTKEANIAEELVMDVMLKLWQKKGEIIIEDNLNAYLFRSMKNALINFWRKKALETSTLDLLKHERYADNRSADYRIICNELEDLYHQKLGKLSPQRKRVFEMSRKENLSYAQIASQLNLSVKTVEQHITSALKYMRENLNVLSDATLLILAFFVLQK